MTKDEAWEKWVEVSTNSLNMFKTSSNNALRIFEKGWSPEKEQTFTKDMQRYTNWYDHCVLGWWNKLSPYFFDATKDVIPGEVNRIMQKKQVSMP